MPRGDKNRDYPRLRLGRSQHVNHGLTAPGSIDAKGATGQRRLTNQFNHVVDERCVGRLEWPALDTPGDVPSQHLSWPFRVRGLAAPECHQRAKVHRLAKV